MFIQKYNNYPQPDAPSATSSKSFSPGEEPLPADFLRVDLLFAEESRIVNSGLYPMSRMSLAYLISLQVALDWQPLLSVGDLEAFGKQGKKSSNHDEGKYRSILVCLHICLSK